MQPVAPPRRRRPRVYSLASLMLLVATCGAISGVVAAALREEQHQQLPVMLGNAIAGAVGGLFIGGSLAASYDLGVGGLLLGCAGGCLCGLAAGGLSGMNLDFQVTLGGAATLIGLAAIFRMAQARASRGEPGNRDAGSPFPDRPPGEG